MHLHGLMRMAVTDSMPCLYTSELHLTTPALSRVATASCSYGMPPHICGTEQYAWLFYWLIDLNLCQPMVLHQCFKIGKGPSRTLYAVRCLPHCLHTLR